MASEVDPAVGLARVDERLTGIEKQLQGIESRMATKESAENIREQIAALTKALSDERVERVAGDKDSKAEIKLVADRLQTVEDRQENRKYLLLSGVVLGVLGIVLGLFGDAISAALGIGG